MVKYKLPRISKNSMLNKGIWVGLALTILSIFGIAVSVAQIALTTALLFALVIVFVVNLIYDYITSTKMYHLQSFVASLFVVLFAYSIIVLLGTSISAVASPIGFVELLVVLVVLEYVGIIIGKEIKW
jgi:hypothetical protein